MCLVGPGNSTKSTILGALEVLFSPRTTVSIGDTDFYDCDIHAELSIEAVVVDLPPELENFETYGPFICGVQDDGTVVPDPDDASSRGITLRFRSDESLEPVWEVVKPGGTLEPRRLSVGTRRALPFFRVDDRSDQHLRWSRGSHLDRMTGGAADARSALVDAHRQARQAVFDADLGVLTATSRQVAQGVTEIGGDAVPDPRVGLDPSVLSTGASLVLHNGPLPFTSYGLGMRRLASLAVQRLESRSASVVAMDEIEHGLEPHRLVRLLHVLRGEAAQGTQVLITTHSPVVVEAVDAVMLAVVRSAGGETSVRSVPPELTGLSGEPQGTIRSGPSAILARRVLVVEGATEEGLLRALTAAWDTPEVNLAMGGVVVRNGQDGRRALQRAECLARLGFEAAALIDHDNVLDDLVAATEMAGARVFRWQAGRCLETQLAHDVPEGLVASLLELAATVKYDDPAVGPSAVRDAVRARLSPGTTVSFEAGFPWGLEAAVARTAIGDAAVQSKWFKSNTAGAALGVWLHAHLDDFGSDPGRSGLARTLAKVRSYLSEHVATVATSHEQ